MDHIPSARPPADRTRAPGDHVPAARAPADWALADWALADWALADWALADWAASAAQVETRRELARQQEAAAASQLPDGSVRLVKKSFAALEPVSADVMQYFYARLFVQHPELRAMFPPAMTSTGSGFSTRWPAGCAAPAARPGSPTRSAI